MKRNEARGIASAMLGSLTPRHKKAFIRGFAGMATKELHSVIKRHGVLRRLPVRDYDDSTLESIYVGCVHGGQM